MPSETLTEDLTRYAIGEKVRALRLKKKLGLVELGEHTGLSPAMLSKIERGRLFPTLPTLLRIAYVFSVGLDYFFAGQRERHVMAIVRRKDRIRLPDRAKNPAAAYHFESLEFPVNEPRLNAFYAEFHRVAVDRLQAHDHPGVEFIYVITGGLELRIGEEEATLAAGDSIYFDATVPHTYRRAGKQPCTALVVTVPPAGGR